MNPRNRKMFRPRNAGRQAAGILASSPQLMQTVQKRANGGANFNPQLASIALQNLAGSARNLEEARRLALANQPATQPTFFGQPAGAAKFGGSTYGGMTFGGNNPRLIPSGPPQRIEGNIFSNLLTPKGKRALSGIMSVIGPKKEPAADMGIGFEDVPDKGTFGAELYRPGTSSPFTGLDVEDADVPPALTDADLEDADTGELVSEQLAKSAVTASGDQTQTDKDTRKKKVLPPESQDTSTSANIIKKLQENIDAATKGSKPPNKINPDQAVTEDPVTMAALVVTDRVNPEEVDLEKITKEATEILGIEPGKLDKRRKDAFYFNLMKAGLAIAAGGDSNALTNIAKGLSFGINEYGKDISALNEEEAENRKEFANLKYRMIKDQETANIAAATATNQWNQNRDQIQNNYNLADYNAKIAQNERERQRLIEDRDYQLRLNDQAYVQATLEANTLFQIGKLQQGDEQLRQKERELTNAETQQIITNNLAFLQTQPPVVKILEANGDLEIVDGKMTFTEQGKENRVQEILTSAALIEAAGTSTKGKATDTTNLAQSISNVYNIDLDEAVILANQIGSDVTLQDAYKDLTGKELPPLQTTQNQQPVTEDGFGSEVSVN